VSRLIPFAWLLFIGVSWGMTQPLTKIAVSGGYQPLGMIFWQMLISVLVLGVINMLRRRPLPLDRRVIGFYIAFALIGTVIPNAASYKAYTVLPSGIMSLLLSLIPMMAFPIALIFGLDRFSIKRMAGLSLGLFAILMIIGVPDALPNAGMLAFIPLGLIPSLMYAFEGNFVARFGTGGAGPLQLLLGASIAGVVITGPIAFATGQWINPCVGHCRFCIDCLGFDPYPCIYPICYDCAQLWAGILGASQLCGHSLWSRLGDAHSWGTLFGANLVGLGGDVCWNLFGQS
jgi:drug/metabolite transporter (DMT)-like permease